MARIHSPHLIRFEVDPRKFIHEFELFLEIFAESKQEREAILPMM